MVPAWSRTAFLPPHYTRFCIKQTPPLPFLQIFVAALLQVVEKKLKTTIFSSWQDLYFLFLQYFSKTYAFALKNALNISIDHSSLLTRRTKKMNKIRFIALEKPFIFFFYNISLRRILSPPDSLIWKLNIILINHEMSARAGPAGPRRAPAHVPPPHPPCVLRLPPPPTCSFSRSY